MNKMYVDSLKYINDTFLSPLRKSVDSPMPMLSLDELTNIASNLETLLNCHVSHNTLNFHYLLILNYYKKSVWWDKKEKFLQSVEERIAKWATNPYVHDLFAEKPSFLEHYNYYVINHYKSLETIDACIEKYPLFAKFLGSLEAEGDVEFKALLSEPLRRVFSYYLIVQVYYTSSLLSS